MSSGKPETSWLKGEILMRLYRMMKEDPNKVFILKDFKLNGSYQAKKYLFYLAQLDLIEVVRIKYYKSSDYLPVGYKFKKNEAQKSVIAKEEN